MSEKSTYARKALTKAVRAAIPTDKTGWGEIANPLHSGGTGNVLGAADELLDLAQGKFQDEINAELDEAIAAKADSSAVYNKVDTDAKLAKKADAESVYTKAEADTANAKKANAADVYTKADTYNRTEIDDKLKAAQGSVFSLQPTVADKAALFAIATAKKGYVYNVDAAVTVGGETYPAKTNFFVLKDFTGATTDDTFAERFDSLGGVFNLDAVNADFAKLYAIVYANHATASITTSKTLIEKGVDTAVTVSWNFGVNGATGDDAKPSSVKVTKSGADWVTDGVATKSKADTIKDSTPYKVVATFPHGATKEAQVTVSARYPIYIVCSAKTALTSADIVAADGDNHKKYVWNSPGTGAAVSVQNAADAQYIWVCVPAGMKITKMQMGGQPMSYEPAATVPVDGKGDYLCYRSSFSQDKGAKNFNIWG